MSIAPVATSSSQSSSPAATLTSITAAEVIFAKTSDRTKRNDVKKTNLLNIIILLQKTTLIIPRALATHQSNPQKICRFKKIYYRMILRLVTTSFL
jgi:hypothetical protein